MDYPNDVPRKAVTVAGIQFSAPMPFVAGPIELTEGMAAAMNQVYHENLRNNFAGRIVKAKEALKEGETLDVEKLTEDFEAYAREYEFGVKASGGGGSRTHADPVDAEAFSMARSIIKDALKQGGFKLADVGEERIRELATQLVERQPEIRTRAAEVVAARVQVGKISLDGLALAVTGTASAPEAPAEAA